MPTRAPPAIIFQAHEVHPEDEEDWTLDADWETELIRRNMRNSMCKDMLLAGRSVQFRSSGNSLHPFVRSGDVTMWEPVKDHSLLEVGTSSFVLCNQVTASTAT